MEGLLKVHGNLSLFPLAPPSIIGSSVYPSDYAFRIVYNGQVLTSQMKGCPADAELCDVNVLLQRTTPLAQVWQEEEEGVSPSVKNGKGVCDLQYPVPVLYTDTVQKAQDFVSTPGGVFAVVLLVLGSFVLGVTVSCFIRPGSIGGGIGSKRAQRRGRP